MAKSEYANEKLTDYGECSDGLDRNLGDEGIPAPARPELQMPGFRGTEGRGGDSHGVSGSGLMEAEGGKSGNGGGKGRLGAWKPKGR